MEIHKTDNTPTVKCECIINGKKADLSEGQWARILRYMKELDSEYEQLFKRVGDENVALKKELKRMRDMFIEQEMFFKKVYKK